MINLHDEHGYSISPANICCAEKRTQLDPTISGIMYHPPAMFVWGKDCRMSYSYTSDSLLDQDFEELEKAMPENSGYIAEGKDGEVYLINTTNVFSVGPVDFNGLEVHFTGGARNVLSFKNPEKVRRFLIENVK